MPEIKQVPCFFKSAQQLIGIDPVSQKPITAQLVVYCPQTSHNSTIADANGQTRAGCLYYHDGLKKCKIDMAIEYGASMAEKATTDGSVERGKTLTTRPNGSAGRADFTDDTDKTLMG